MRRLLIKTVIIGSAVGIVSLITSCGVMTSSYGVAGNSYINGFWEEWRDISYNLGVSGDINDFYLHERGSHPSDWTVHFEINSLRKSDIKGNKSYRYSGRIELWSSAQTEKDAFHYLAKQGSALNIFMHSYKYPNEKLYRVPVSVLVYKRSGHLYYNFFYGNDGVGIALPINRTI